MSPRIITRILACLSSSTDIVGEIALLAVKMPSFRLLLTDEYSHCDDDSDVSISVWPTKLILEAQFTG